MKAFSRFRFITSYWLLANNIIALEIIYLNCCFNKKVKMEHKFLQKDASESGFNFLDLDDGFFMTVDSDLNKNKISEKQFDLANKCNLKKAEELEYSFGKKDYDLPLFIEDLNESDFFTVNERKGSNFQSKVIDILRDEREIESSGNDFAICLSPVQGPKVSDKVNLTASTPVKVKDDSNCKENFLKNLNKVEEKAKVCDFDFLEADLFDDWDVTEMNKNEKETDKSTVTFSQALKLIEEAETGRDFDKEYLNHSIDLLTGELIGSDVGNMFEESFDLPKSAEKKCRKESSSDSLIIIENGKIESKLSAPQKLKFDFEKIDDKDIVLCKENNLRSTCFSSDDDFDFHTQDLLKKSKQVLECDISNASDVNALNECDLNDSADAVAGLRRKRGKRFNIIDSDTTEGSPSPKFHRQNKIKMRKNFSENIGKEFIDSEAEVSDKVEVSSDEEEEEGEYDKSFVDEKSYFSQNCEANMTAKYLQSVKSIKRFGSFKIPALKPYNPYNVFSQIPEENNTEYEIDSFCVNEIEEEIKTDLSDLEIAEKIIEMNRKKKKKKRSQKLKKCK